MLPSVGHHISYNVGNTKGLGSNPAAAIEQTSGCLIVVYYNSQIGKEAVNIIPG